MKEGSTSSCNKIIVVMTDNVQNANKPSPTSHQQGIQGANSPLLLKYSFGKGSIEHEGETSFKCDRHEYHKYVDASDGLDQIYNLVCT